MMYAIKSQRTAFRRKCKIYYDTIKKKKKVPRPVDLLSEVIDFSSVLENYKLNGFYFIPGALSVEEQCKWIRESLVSFPQPPNLTNHNAIYGPIDDLFISANEEKVLVSEERFESDTSHTESEGSVSQWKFVEKSGGLNGKNERKSNRLLFCRIPDSLWDMARKMAEPAVPRGEEFQPEAAIVNYFGLGDMLGARLDDMEKDWSKPYVSMRFSFQVSSKSASAN